MEDWFSFIDKKCELSADARRSLDEAGFAVIPNLISGDRLLQLSAAYDAAFSAANDAEMKISRTTTRVSDFIN